MLAVLFYLACVGLLVTASLLGPVVVSLLAGDHQLAQRFSIYLLLGVFLFGGPALAISGRQRRIPKIAHLALVLLVWTVVPALAAIPIADISDLDALDALFEAVSGLTTTGATTLNTVEIWPQPLIFWRSQLQWIGGYLTLLTIVLILAPLGIGGLTNRRASIGGGGEIVAGQMRVFVLALNMGLLYAVVTGICFLAFFLSGTRAFYAMTLAMSAVSTGGFLPFDDSLDEILGVFGLFVFGLFLTIGATSVFWQRMLIGGKLARLAEHRESYSVILLILFLTVVFALSLVAVSANAAQEVVGIFVESFLNAASLVATSGIETRPGIFSLLPLIVVLFVVLAGGSAFSTSGGLKHYRLGGMLVQSWSELDRLVYPNAMRPSRFGSQIYDIELLKAIWSFFVVAFLTIGFGTIFVATTGIPFDAALTAAIAAFSNAGPVYEAGWAAPGTEPWAPFSAFSTTAKVTLMVIMVLGRLEVLAIIGLFSIRYWQQR